MFPPAFPSGEASSVRRRLSIASRLPLPGEPLCNGAPGELQKKAWRFAFRRAIMPIYRFTPRQRIPPSTRLRTRAVKLAGKW
jgi:hypothetical protein